MPKRGIELIAFVGNLSKAHMCRAGRRQRRPTRRRSDLQCLLAGPDGRIQAPLSALNLPEFKSGRFGRWPCRLPVTRPRR